MTRSSAPDREVQIPVLENDTDPSDPLSVVRAASRR